MCVLFYCSCVFCSMHRLFLYLSVRMSTLFVDIRKKGISVQHLSSAFVFRFAFMYLFKKRPLKETSRRNLSKELFKEAYQCNICRWHLYSAVVFGFALICLFDKLFYRSLVLISFTGRFCRISSLL